MRDIYGIKLGSPGTPRQLGPFTVYHYPHSSATLNARTKTSPEQIWRSQTPNYLVEYCAVARDADRAIEIADSYFEKLEHILQFMVARVGRRYHATVLKYGGPHDRHAYVFRDNGEVNTTSSAVGPLSPYALDNKYLQSRDLTHFGTSSLQRTQASWIGVCFCLPNGRGNPTRKHPYQTPSSKRRSHLRFCLHTRKEIQLTHRY